MTRVRRGENLENSTGTSTFAGAGASLSQELRMAASSDNSNLVQRSQQKDKSKRVKSPEEDTKDIANDSTPKQRLQLKGYHSSKFVNCYYFFSGLLAMGFVTVTLINNRVSDSMVVFQIVIENQNNRKEHM